MTWQRVSVESGQLRAVEKLIICQSIFSSGTWKINLLCRKHFSRFYSDYKMSIYEILEGLFSSLYVLF